MLTLPINNLSTPQSHFNICHNRMLHILPPWSPCPEANLDLVAVICCGRQAVWMFQRHAMEGYWICLCQRQRVYSSTASQGHKHSEQCSEPAKGEWERFPWKEIKVKRMIKVRFPASWFVFCTEIPFFLSVFAETTIAALPVLVTVTLNPISVVCTTDYGCSKMIM